jgi:hypothetical protein
MRVCRGLARGSSFIRFSLYATSDVVAPMTCHASLSAYLWLSSRCTTCGYVSGHSYATTCILTWLYFSAPENGTFHPVPPTTRRIYPLKGWANSTADEAPAGDKPCAALSVGRDEKCHFQGPRNTTRLGDQAVEPSVVIIERIED